VCGESPRAVRCGDRPEHLRVVRGGAFNNNHRNARVANRNRNNPNNRNDNNGFRVVVSTLLNDND